MKDIDGVIELRDDDNSVLGWLFSCRDSRRDTAAGSTEGISHYDISDTRLTLDIPECRQPCELSVINVSHGGSFARGYLASTCVMLDCNLADMYGVETRILNRAVSRNAARFPLDSAFTLTAREVESLRSQFGISNTRGGRRYAPRVFTEQGVAMLSSVLRSRRAIDVNIAIMRAFVQLREMLSSHKDLARRIDELEARYDGTFVTVFDAIRGR